MAAEKRRSIGLADGRSETGAHLAKCSTLDPDGSFAAIELALRADREMAS